MEEATITIDKKVEYTGGAERPPAGDFYCNEVKYTCWDKDEFKKHEVGDTIKFSYTSNQNEYNGKTYTNRNISKMLEFDEKDRPSMPDTDELKPQNTEYEGHPQSELKAGRVTINGDTYEVVLRLV